MVIVRFIPIFLTLWLLTTIDPVKAQNRVNQPTSDNIIILINDRNQRLKELYVGDFIKIELINSTKVKGTIRLIESEFITVGDRRISFDEILKFSTRRTWVRIMGGGLILSGLIISLTQSLEPIADPKPSDLALVSIPLYGVGLAMVLPNYHEIGKYMLVVAPND